MFARAYICLLHLALLISALLLHSDVGSRAKLWYKILHNVLVPLEFASVPLHTLVCSVIGMDKIYILHLICSGIFWSFERVYSMYISKNPDYALLVAYILTMLAYWIFNFRTRILYLSTFRFTVNNTDIDNRTLFRRICKWWILMHLILVPYHICTLLYVEFPKSYRWYLLRALLTTFEIKMYLSLTPTIEKWSYIFSKRSYLLEKFYVFCILFYTLLWFMGITSVCTIVTVPDQVHRFLKIIGETMWAIRWVWLYFYAKEKLDDFVFQCIDEDSHSDFFHEFEFASKKTNPWESIDKYEPKRTLKVINL